MKKICENYKKYMKSFPNVLKIIGTSSLLIVLLQELLLFRINPLFPCAHELGLIFQKILLSFVAGIILYFIITHFPKIRKKESVSTIIRNAFFKINHLASNLIYTVYENTGNKLIEDINSIKKEDLLKIIIREDMRKQQRFTFDSIEYQDVMYLLSAVRRYFDQYYNLIVPYIEYLDKDVLVELNKIINQIYIIHDPIQLLKERTIISPGIYADIIITLNESSRKLRI